MSKPVVIYHGGCMDGFGAAWAAWKVFRDKASYIPSNYGDPVPEEVNNNEVFLLDYSYREDVLYDIFSRCNRLVIIDHHKTTEHYVKQFTGSIHDVNHSGAMLSWDYFHGKFNAPKLIQYIEDHDLYTFKLEKSREINDWIYSLPFDFQTYEFASVSLENNFKTIYKEATVISRYKEKVIDEICKNSQLTWFCGYMVPVVNTPFLQSDVGHKLCLKYPDAEFSVSYYDKEDIRNFSLRSINFDVTKITSQFNGGGHEHAAGFRIKRESITNGLY